MAGKESSQENNINDIPIEKFNESINNFTGDLDKAIDRYFKSGAMNIALLIGAIELKKQMIWDYLKSKELKDNCAFKESPESPEYIG